MKLLSFFEGFCGALRSDFLPFAFVVAAFCDAGYLFLDRNGVLADAPTVPETGFASGSSNLATDGFFFKGDVASYSISIPGGEGFFAYAPLTTSGFDSAT